MSPVLPVIVRIDGGLEFIVAAASRIIRISPVIFDSAGITGRSGSCQGPDFRLDGPQDVPSSENLDRLVDVLPERPIGVGE